MEYETIHEILVPNINKGGDKEMTEFEFLLTDRIQKIKSMNEKYNLEENAYIAFSGGKDSTVLHYLIDEALPNNKIPRVYADTLIDYRDLRNFVLEMKEKDERINIVCHGLNIRESLEKTGYPFKSKIHATMVSYRQRGLETDYIKFYFRKPVDYKGKGKRQCPNNLLYQWDFNDFKISDRCCINMKEKPMQDFGKKNNRNISITGIRANEGGRRAAHGKCAYIQGNKLKSFNPLFPLDDSFLDEYIKTRNIKLCKLYYPPYNFTRTGCKGCPFSRTLQTDLEVMAKLLPNEKKQCELLWKPVYDEYRKIGFRLRKESAIQLLFNFD